MNIIIGAGCLFFCIYVASMLSKKYTNRHKFYNDFMTFNQLLKREILYTQNTIKNILESINESDYKNLLYRVHNGEAFDTLEYLSKEEMGFAVGYLNSIGKSDNRSQIEYVNSVEQVLESKLVQTMNEEKKYKQLYLKLGVLIGLICFIIFL